MGIPIRIDNYERCYPSRLKKIFLSGLNYRTYKDFVPKAKNQIVGNIPPELIRFFPKETRGQNIKDVQQALGETAVYLRETLNKLRRDEDFRFLDSNYKPSKFMKKLTHEAKKQLTEKLNKIAGEGKLKATLKYIDRGDYANVFRLSIMDTENNRIMHDKALKVFENISEPYALFALKHNNYAEANFWTFIKHFAGHKLDKTQFTKHYISDMKNGYCLTEMIDESIPTTKFPINYKKFFGIQTPEDSQFNRPIMGKLYDGGGYLKDKDFTADKVIIRYLKKLLNRSKKELPTVLANIEALAKNPKTPHRNKIQQAIDLFKKRGNL